MFKYEWIWESNKSPNFAQAPYMPLKNVENVLVFSFGGCAHPAKNRMKYNPQGVTKVSKVCKQKTVGKYLHRGGMPTAETYEQRGTGYPTQVIRVDKDSKPLHPTQKPVALFEYLIKTYTNEGDLVLDNCIGSGTTAVACINTNRRFIGIEISEEYCKIANGRLEELKSQVEKT
jgi:site-specific DNA-methyltransferase (adenine-specific)